MSKRNDTQTGSCDKDCSHDNRLTVSGDEQEMIAGSMRRTVYAGRKGERMTLEGIKGVFGREQILDRIDIKVYIPQEIRKRQVQGWKGLNS